MQTEGGLNSGSLQMAVLIYALYRRTENQWDEEPSCCSHKLIYWARIIKNIGVPTRFKQIVNHSCQLSVRKDVLKKSRLNNPGLIKLTTTFYCLLLCIVLLFVFVL